MSQPHAIPKDEKPMSEGPGCEGSPHDFGGEPICMLCGANYAEIYCDAYNGEER